MDSGILSDLVGSGIITSKMRLLCFRDKDDSARAWLLRRRVKADVIREASRAYLTAGQRRYYDLVLIHWEQGHGLTPDSQNSMLREAVPWVRPAGWLLVVYEADGLFDDISSDAAVAQVTDCLKKEELHSIRLLPRLEDSSSFGIMVKKGGAYKPRATVAYIDTPDGFAQCCERLMREQCLGLDVETTLKEPRILCTTQLATESRVYILDMLPIKELSPLKRLMENKAVLKIIHNKAFEQKVLGQYGIQIHSIYDTLQEARKRRKKTQVGGHKLGEVCERDLGIFLDKSLQASDWTVRPLTPEQLDYAAADAEVLMRLYRLYVPPPPPETMALF